jgi:hypothetical protein
MTHTGWRDVILDEFVPNVNKLTIAIDPDNLLTEEKLLFELKKRGFDLFNFDDHIEFRYLYELKYRSLWDQGKEPSQAVVLRLSSPELKNLPYDLLQAGRIVTFSLGNIFPNFSYSVIEKINHKFLDALFDAQNNHSPYELGDNATKDFILNYIFNICPKSINNDVELLHTLLRIHYNKINIPPIFSIRLVQILKDKNLFRDWPLDIIISEERAFFSFLQERWPIFLDGLSNDKYILKESSDYNLKYEGPILLPFNHKDIYAYLDNLFVEGKLIPVKKTVINIESYQWIRSGISENKDVDEQIRINRLLEMTTVPAVESSYSEWLSFAMKWAELRFMVNTTNYIDELNRFNQISSTLQISFTKWLINHYSVLINYPPTKPVMLHHIPRYLERKMRSKVNTKLALVIVDGLSFDQWVTVKQILHEQYPSYTMEESAIFAWIPTLTSVSRQAIFSGKSPNLYPNSINTTEKESDLWSHFWENAGLSCREIGYQRSLGDGNVRDILDEKFDLNQTKVLGLVVDKVDKIMHGIQTGSKGMHNQIKQWCQEGFLSSLINYLLDNGYQVWLTSDHGNIECKGKGCPSEGAIAETRGERVRVYSTTELRDRFARSFPFAIKWDPVGLPDNYYPLVVEGSDAFVKEGEIIVGHGGISMEEVIVPLIMFEKRSY